MAALSDWDEQFEARWLKRSIEEIIAALDKHRKNVNISRVTGSSVAIATGGRCRWLYHAGWTQRYDPQFG